jgi:hypothetical protein
VEHEESRKCNTCWQQGVQVSLQTLHVGSFSQAQSQKLFPQLCGVHSPEEFFEFVLFVCLCFRISREKWPRGRNIQWLASLPEGVPALFPAVQPADAVVQKWLNAVNQKKWIE